LFFFPKQLMENIKNIIFDYGNVIFDLDFQKGQKAWAALGVDNPGKFYDFKITDTIFDAFEKGEITPEEFRNDIRSKIGNPLLTDKQIDTAWNSILIGIEDGKHELLLNLKSSYRTFLLSNINAIHYDYIHQYLKSDFGFDGNEHLFEKVYYSHLVGKRKPDAAIFRQVLNENNLNANDTLFIDDNAQNIEAAKHLGIKTHLLTDPDTIFRLFSDPSGALPL
jgi:glucose-1-phosphatase